MSASRETDRPILGISCDFHDSAAALVDRGVVVAAAQEERFSRRKHDPRFPQQAIEYCLGATGCTADDLAAVVFYEKPYLKLERNVFTHFDSWPGSFRTFLDMQRSWFGGKARIRSRIRKRIPYRGPILFCRHHESHAASAFFPSPFPRATVVTVDGVGEWATTTVWLGDGDRLQPLREIHFPHSIGLFYSAFTAYLGFEVNEDEYKVMGLAPYGKPAYVDRLAELIQLHDDGSFELNRRFFAFERSNRMLDLRRVERLLGVPRRVAGEPLEAVHQDLAASIQAVLERAMLSLCRRAVEATGERRLCLAGGVALNCTANGKLRDDPAFESMFVFPAAGDAGGAVGAALFTHHHVFGGARAEVPFPTPLLGPAFTQEEVGAYLERAGIPHRTFADEELPGAVARMLADQKIVGWFQGRMEFGPRALGNRSILGDPTCKDNWPRINRKVKFREDFRPLAPAVVEERAADYFELAQPSPYMLFTAQTRSDRLPAVTHVDGSARVQTVARAENPLFHRLISAFGELTGVPVLINTSFNTAGMPIVCTPQNAFQCFAEADLDVLVLGRSVILRDQIVYLAGARR